MTPSDPDHKTGRRIVALALLAVSVALAALGQTYFFFRRNYLWDGLVWHGLAILCFLLAWRVSASSSSGLPPTRKRSFLPGALRILVRQSAVWLSAHRAASVFLAAGVVLSAVAVLLVRHRTWDQATHDVVALWLLGVLATGCAAFWPPAAPRGSPRLWKARLRRIRGAAWYEVATVAGLTALAFLLRASALETVPYTLGGDEAWHGLLARQVLDAELRNPFVMGYLSMPTFFYWPVAWSLRWVGNNVVGLRLLAALAGTATVPAFYLLVRRLWGQRTALIAAGLLATYEVHVHYSRLGANNVWDPLWAVLLFWLLDRGFGRSDAGLQRVGTAAARRRDSILTGAVLGVSVYFYTGARLLPILVAAYVGFNWLMGTRLGPSRDSQDSGSRDSHTATTGRVRAAALEGHLVLLALVAFLIVSGPMLGFAAAHPDDWNARVNQVGIFQSGWLAREPGLTGKSTGRILAEQFLRSAGAFHAFPDRTVWYGADRPLLGFLAGLFAVFGLAWAFVHWRERRYFLVLVWFWAVILTGGVLTENPPSSQRLVMAFPPAILLVTVGLEQAVGLAGRLVRGRPGPVARVTVGSGNHAAPTASPDAQVGAERGGMYPGGKECSPRWQSAALGVLILILAVSSISFYFARYIPSRAYGSQNAETATMIGYYLQDQPAGTRVHFFGAPRIYWSFGTMTFLAPQVTGQDVVEPLTDAPGAVQDGGPQIFIFLPERAGEFTFVRQAYPDGRLNPGLDRWGNERYVAYEVR